VSQQLLNGTFENSTIPGGKQTFGSNGDSTGSWSFSGTAGLHTPQSWFNGRGGSLTAPNGGNVAAYLFAANGGTRGAGLIAAADLPTISQVFNATPGSYTLSFYAAQQNAGAAALLLNVKLKSADGRDFWDFSVTPGQGYAQSSFPVTLRAQNYTLTFQAEPPLYLGRRGATTYNATYVSGMILLDDVSIV
jgi:hypothetical protein